MVGVGFWGIVGGYGGSWGVWGVRRGGRREGGEGRREDGGGRTEENGSRGCGSLLLLLVLVRRAGYCVQIEGVSWCFGCERVEFLLAAWIELSECTLGIAREG